MHISCSNGVFSVHSYTATCQTEWPAMAFYGHTCRAGRGEIVQLETGTPEYIHTLFRFSYIIHRYMLKYNFLEIAGPK